MASLHPLLQSHRSWITKLGISAAVALLIILVTQEGILGLGIIQRLELAAIDYRFSFRGPDLTMKNSGNVVIVEISEDSFKSLPEKWPWPRSYYAHLLKNLRAAGARAVGLDIIFGGNDLHSASYDEELRKAIKETGFVVLAGKIEEEKFSYDLKTSHEDYGNIFFDVDSSIGLVNIRNDADGVYRRYRPFLDTRNGLRIPSFSFALLNRYASLPPLSIAENFSNEFIFEHTSIPKYDAVSMLINFYGPSGTFRRIKFADVIDDATITTNEEALTGSETNTFDDPDYGYLYDGTFKDKIVLVGSTLPEEHDLFPVAMAKGDEAGDNLMYGVEIHANVIESMLRKDFLTKQSVLTEILSVFLLTIITFLVTSSLKGSKTRHHFLVELNGFLFALAEISLIGYISLYVFTHYNYLVTVISPILAVVGGYFASTAYHFVVERKQRVLIKSMFSTYVNPTVVEELILNPEKLTLGGERRELSVLFSDIEGFTTISEGMPPEQLVGLLNEYLSAMTAIILKNHGTLDKYEGDAVMAFWGAPIRQNDHAVRACLSAVEMQEALVEIRRSWDKQNKPLINVRIGINSGEMVVGNMGGMGKFDYTVIGDSVNLASRLEGTNKLYRTRIIASERTYDLVKDRILGRELDLIAVKGRTEPLRIYELIQTMNSRRSTNMEKFLEEYAHAVRMFRNRCWREARTLFEEAQKIQPEDFPTQLYIERAKEYELNPPADDWNGVFVMSTK